MTLYLTIFKTTVAEYLVYRLNFILWRARVVITVLIKYFLWLAVFDAQSSLFGYTESQMLTYILLSSLIEDIVLASRAQDIGGQILDGKIIDYVLKPMNFFRYHLTRDFADKSLNVGFAFAETIAIIFLLNPPLFIQSDISTYALVAFFIVIGIIISFFVSISLSFVAFWTPEVWSIRFIFFMLVLLFSGRYFPLDILPEPLYYILFLTPFPYLFFIPTRVYLGAPTSEIILFVVSGLTWVGLSYWFTRTIWRKGLKEYSFFGR